jgi:hypothetical protein
MSLLANLRVRRHRFASGLPRLRRLGFVELNQKIILQDLIRRKIREWKDTKRSEKEGHLETTSLINNVRLVK